MSNLVDFRRAKDEFFESHPQSPLTHDQRHAFGGLAYFPENEDLRINVEVERFEDQQQIEMQTTTGDFQSYVRFGKFKFRVDEETAELTLYEGPHGFFLPFVDDLAGKETYGAGRYLEPEALADGKFFIDFNMAYNPYCAYNELYSCPITPFENRVKVPIRAGEMIFKN
jgi:uncharacterized protein (DUF1684 family)